jgi:hypothetical protein
MGGGLRRYSRQAEDVMTFVAELKRRNERLCSLSLIGSIDGGEGWGEGAARPIAMTRTKIERIPQIERIPLTQPSAPSALGGEGLKRLHSLSPIGFIDGGEGLKHCVAAIATAAAGMRRTP